MTSNWIPVKLAARVLGHISQGMYRTPAGAVKELISNAYDAGASYAKIHTGFPRFDFFSCEDDGSGISREKFLALMNGGIGDSEKQAAGQQFGKNGRPLIGRLGVGLLSLAQICPRFNIRSYHGESQTAFEAEIEFPPYSRKEIDQAIADQRERDSSGPISHGQFQINDLKYDAGRTGIIVTTSSLRDAFRKKMSNLDQFANLNYFHTRESYPNFSSFLDAIAQPSLKSLYFASQYDQFLFQLALAAPLPYIELNSSAQTLDKAQTVETVLTRIPQIAKLQAKIKGYEFRAEVDNINVFRPVVLPRNGDRTMSADCILPAHPVWDKFDLRDGGYKEEVQVQRYDIKVKGSDVTFKVFWFEYERKVNGYPLQFKGYIFLQTSRLFPKEYQGLLIRVRNVAIGPYDVNIMTYPTAEGPRFSMLSAEVFVEEGLDDALKVDRDGFNTLDPQYIRLQAFIHSILHSLIFPESWGEEKQRNLKRREEREAKVSRKFDSALDKATSKAIKSVRIVTKTDSPAARVPVELDKRTRTVRIYESNPTGKSILGRRKFRGLASRVIAAFEAANLERTPERRRDVFYRLIEDIFSE